MVEIQIEIDGWIPIKFSSIGTIRIFENQDIHPDPMNPHNNPYCDWISQPKIESEFAIHLSTIQAQQLADALAERGFIHGKKK